MPKNKKQPGFPKEILRDINEFSPGGFSLFIFNEEGMPQMYNSFDDPVHAMAMQYYIDSWTKAIESANIGSRAGGILDDIEEEGNDE